ncbi:MAG: hypothetical protein ABIR92_10605, partial [Gemmatimonadaceae bacterium]
MARIALVAMAVMASGASAQTLPAANPSVRVFLDCNFCDHEFLQVETPWVVFVRDRAASDVHLLLTRIETGGSGRRYDLEVLGQGPAARRDTVVFETGPAVTEDAVRREIARNIQLGLVPYALRTSAARGLR